MLLPATPSQTAADKLALQVFINITHFYHCQSRFWKKKKSMFISACLSTSAVCSASLLGHPFPGQVSSLVFIFWHVCPIADGIVRVLEHTIFSSMVATDIALQLYPVSVCVCAIWCCCRSRVYCRSKTVFIHGLIFLDLFGCLMHLTNSKCITYSLTT